MTTDTRIRRYAEATAAVATHVAYPKDTSNTDRGRLVTEHYQAVFDDLDLQPATVMRDLLTDLHHFAASLNIPLAEQFESAAEVFLEEVALATTTPDDGPRVIARVQPQAWDARNNAVDAGPAISVDVTALIDQMSPEQRAAIEDHSDTSDNLYADAVIRGLAPAHSGPYYVEVEESLRTWEAASCDDCHAEGREVAVAELVDGGEAGDIVDVDRLAEARVQDGQARCARHES